MTHKKGNEVGITESERLLARLCRKSFLRLWSYPNLYRDQGPGDARKGHGKELCDLVVVFGNDIVLFSDKHCEWPKAGDLQLRWTRWHRRAILGSAKQVVGAERWLTKYPDRVFRNRDCTQSFPISLPNDPTFHRVLTCRGAAEACREALGGTGSLMVSNLEIEDGKEPFVVGCKDAHGRFYHVMDEVALELILGTLDTISDLVRYLSRKMAFFGRHDQVRATGEEDLVAFYLGQTTKMQDHDFQVDESCAFVGIDESHWQWWVGSPQREAKITADEISYSWDRLIEKFSHHMMEGDQHFATPGGLKEQEKIVRWMAAESRVRRRILAESLHEMLRATPVGMLRRRMALPKEGGEPLWVFLVLPRKPEMDFERYRDFRLAFLEAHCLVAKYLNPGSEHIVGIAMDGPRADITEDALYLDAREWGSTDDDNARSLYEDLGIFLGADRFQSTHFEFPLKSR